MLSESLNFKLLYGFRNVQNFDVLVRKILKKPQLKLSTKGKIKTCIYKIYIFLLFYIDYKNLSPKLQNDTKFVIKIA